MPPTKKNLRRAIVCASITADGKLGETDTLSVGFFESLALGAEDVVLTERGAAEQLSLAERIRPAQWVSLGKYQKTADILNILRARRVFCFGGPWLFRALFDDGQVDELRLSVRPKIDGRRDAPGLSGVPGDFFPASVRCRLLKMEVCGDECLLHYRVLRTRTKRPATVESEASSTR